MKSKLPQHRNNSTTPWPQPLPQRRNAFRNASAKVLRKALRHNLRLHKMVLPEKHTNDTPLGDAHQGSTGIIGPDAPL